MTVRRYFAVFSVIAAFAACAQVQAVPIEDDLSEGDASVPEAAGPRVDAVALVEASIDAGTDAGNDGAVIFAAPTFSPDPTSYEHELCVTITAIIGTVHYTTDGSTPTEASPIFTGPFVVSVPGATIKAITIVDGRASDVATAIYGVVPPAEGAVLPTFAPHGGLYDASVTVGMSTTTVPSLLCYSLDGGAPGCDTGIPPLVCGVDGGPPQSPSCTGYTYEAGSPITLTGDSGTSTTLRAQACSDLPSEITTETYTF